MASKLRLMLIFIAGLRFDIFSVLITNAVFILLHLVPAKWFLRKNYQKLLKFLYYGFNIPPLLLNCVDFIYFRFTQKRTTGDLFTHEMAGDIKNNILNYVADFWYVLLIFIVLVFLIEYLYRKISFPGKSKKNHGFIPSFLYAATIVFLFIIGARGGLQFKPITMQAAARYSPPQLIPLVLNTPFAIIKTYNLVGLSNEKYMSDEEAEKLVSIHQKLTHDLPFRKLNVVIIIMESFSKEYIGFFNHGKGYTPFLDSLCSHSLVCDNAYANAKRSIEGIPAVTASLPNLMDDPFITSAYNTTHINGIAGLLHPSGYSSAFFHGGNNGTMGIENFSILAGYDKYYGRSEYKGPSTDYDGNWGIYDEPFLSFFKNQIDKIRQPFCVTFFSISSHHPYNIPDKYKNYFPKGNQAIHESIGYADFSLHSFFKAASNAPWFANTLFVITADHTGPSVEPYYQTSKGIFEVPVIYFCPADTSLNGITSVVTQQCDILPSILDYLHYDNSFAAFGNSVFRNGDHYAVNYSNNLFQFFDNENMLQSDGEKTIGLYQYKKDSFLLNNIALNAADQELKIKLKSNALLQEYRQALIHNKLVK